MKVDENNRQSNRTLVQLTGNNFVQEKLYSHAKSNSENIKKIKLTNNERVKRQSTDELENQLLNSVITNSSHEVLQILDANEHINVNREYEINGLRTSLFNIATIKNYSFVVEILLKYGADPYLEDSTQNTPLHNAVIFNYAVIVISILKNSIKGIDRQNSLGKTPLHLAVETEINEIASILLDYGANSYISDFSEGWTVLHLAAEKKNIFIVEQILKINKNGINKQDSDGDTALILAALNNDVDICGILLINGACPYIFDHGEHWTPLIAAAAEGHQDVVDLLVSWSKSDPLLINMQDKVGGTALYWAVESNHFEVVKILLKHGADPNIPEEYGYTPLHAAAYRNFANIVQLLITTEEAIIDIRNNEGDTPLSLAAEFNSLQAVCLLLDNGGDSYEITHFVKKWTPLHAAAFGGHLQIILQILQRNKSGINIQDKLDHTALFLAADQNHSDVVLALLANNAAPNIGNLNNWTPLHSAVDQGFLDIVEKLLAAKSTKIDIVNNEGDTPLILSAFKGHDEILNYLLNKGSNPYAKDNLGTTVLHAAVLSESITTVKLVVSKIPLNIDTPDYNNNIPLHIAINLNSSDIVEFLLQKGSDPQIRGKNGRTALHFACSYGYLNVIKMMAKNTTFKSFLEIQDHQGKTPLLISASFGYKGIMEYLVDVGADLFATDLYEQNILYIGAQFCDKEVFEKILQKSQANRNRTEKTKMFFNRKSFYGISPLAATAAYGNEELFFFVQKNIGDINITDYRGHTILDYAVIGGRSNIITNILKEINILVNHKSLMGYTPLMAAVEKGHVKAFNLLIQNGAKIKVETTLHKTLLHWAAIGGKLDIINAVIDVLGGNIDIKDAEGYTPLMYAVKNDKIDAVKVFLQNRADPLVENIYNENSIHIAAQEGFFGILKLFSELDYNVDSILGIVLAHKNTIQDHNLLKLLTHLIKKSSISKSPLFYAAAMGNDTELEKLFLLNTVLQRRAFPYLMKEFLNDYDNALEEFVSEDELLPSKFERLTPLDMALIFFGQVSTIKIIVKNLKINRKYFLNRKTMWSVLDFAAFGYRKYQKSIGIDKVQVFHFMLKMYNGSLNTPNNIHGWTIAHKAAWMGDKNIIGALKNYNVNLFQRDRFGRTPLHIAALKGQAEAVEILLHMSRKHLNTKDIHDFTPLHLALIYRHKKFFARLSVIKSDLPFKERYEFIESPNSLLDNSTNYFLTAHLLIHDNEELDARDKAFGWTALHWAAAYGDLLLAALLVSRGAGVNIPSWSGETPMKIARRWGRIEMYHFLRSKNGVW